MACCGGTVHSFVMQTFELSISGAFRCVPTVHGDQRGSFSEYFKADLLGELLGHPVDVAQGNCSVSAAGVLRGIHFADVPPGQAKYVTCAAGAIVDVVVDIRVGSPTFGQHEAVLLTAQNREAVYLGEGLGHAFMALADNTTVMYLCSTGYCPEREHGIHPLDPALGISWPEHSVDGAPLEPVLSAKDEQAPTLAQAQATNLLPTLSDVDKYLELRRCGG